MTQHVAQSERRTWLRKTLEIPGAVPRTRGGRLPLDLNHPRSPACVRFVTATGIAYVRVNALRWWVLARGEIIIRKSISMPSDLKAKL